MAIIPNAWLAVGLFSSAIAADPLVTNVRAEQIAGSKRVEIQYDISGETSPVHVSLQISSDGGTSFAVPANTLSGDVGAGISLGRNKSIVWNAGTDWNNQLSNTVKFRVTASDTAPLGTMVFIPGGTFQMGDAFTEGSVNELPVHSVYVSGFYLQNTEVTKAQWDAVANWAAANGYDFNAAGGSGKAANHPVYNVTWYEAVKYCNARSQLEGLTPCYAVSEGVYKLGSSVPECNWNASGYRLPTEAEWEKAVRGGLSGRRFPGGDTINHDKANYRANGSAYIYDTSPYATYTNHPTYNDGRSPYTSPVGSFAPNGFGVYDSEGNVREWCWDWYDSNYFSSSASIDPRGPETGTSRVRRGGGWSSYADGCRSALRSSNDPGDISFSVGFRTARSSASVP